MQASAVSHESPGRLRAAQAPAHSSSSSHEEPSALGATQVFECGLQTVPVGQGGVVCPRSTDGPPAPPAQLIWLTSLGSSDTR